METRLLVNRGDEWDAYDYIWNEAQNEAYYDVVGDIKEVTWIDEEGTERKVDYIIPNKNQCKGCHVQVDDIVILGPKVRVRPADMRRLNARMRERGSVVIRIGAGMMVSWFDHTVLCTW